MGGWLAEIMLRVRDGKVPQEPALKITPLATEPREGITASVHKDTGGSAQGEGSEAGTYQDPLGQAFYLHHIYSCDSPAR